MRTTRPTVAVPPVARARALGALVPRGQHAIAYATDQADGVLAGFALEGLEAGERVLVLAGSATPRALGARLRAQGVAAPASRPAALRIVDPRRVAQPLALYAAQQAELAAKEGCDGLRIAHLPAEGQVLNALRAERSLPRRFDAPLTMLCIYSDANAARVDHAAAWGASHAHERILVL